MILVSKTYWKGLPFWFHRAPEDAMVDSLVLRAHDMRQFRALYWTSKRHERPKVGVILIHPRIDFGHHYTVPWLLEAGVAVLAASTRHVNNDTMAEHEEMVLDVASCVRHLKERRGIEKVVLLGNSGGGSLLAYYQAQARLPPSERIRRSPGGAPTHFDSAPMTAADAMVYIAAHKGQGKMLMDAIDPSVLDESDPLSVAPELDMYDECNGFREPPEWSEFAPEFVTRYRKAQLERVTRLDAKAKELIARHADATRASEEPGFAARDAKSRRDILRTRACEPVMVIYRTMANPACVDRRIDPSGRDYGSLLSERPDLMNYAALGLARTLTPRAWLSTWSALSSNADLARNVAHITEPTLFVSASRDREVLPADAAAIEAAIASPDKKTVTLDARHYFEADLEAMTGKGAVPEMMRVVTNWMNEKVS